MQRLSLETLEELDWCLDQLEAIQAHRSMGDLATTKFRRMLNKELSQFSESKSGSQISGYIRSFLGKSVSLASWAARPALRPDADVILATSRSCSQLLSGGRDKIRRATYARGLVARAKAPAKHRARGELGAPKCA